MMILREIDVAPTCFVSELILWLAIGRPPVAAYASKDGDFRTDVRSFETGRYDILSDGFSRGEFEAVGASTDFDEYEAVLFFDEMPSDAPEHFKHGATALFEYADKKNLSFDEAFREQEEYRQNYLAEQESVFDWHIEKATVGVLSKIFDQTLSTTGAPEIADDSGYADLGELEEIDARSWSVHGFDFQSTSLKASDRTYRMVQVDTQSAFEVFQTPFLEPVSIPTDQYGSYFIASTASDEPNSAARRRGRPKKSLPSIETILRKEFFKRLREGALPEKREAIIEEAMTWCKDTLVAEISRTVAQRYLKPIFDKMPKKVARK